MKCPNCDNELIPAKYKDLDLDKCPGCAGMWFDLKELDDLEDTAFSDDESKGSLVWDKKQSERKCPKCNKEMVKFNYRLDNLELEYCEDMHGYWLDKGEEERVTDEMKKRIDQLDKKYEAEEEWAGHLKRLQSRSFFSKLKSLLG